MPSDNADGLDVPGFLRIPQAAREAAWALNPPRASPAHMTKREPRTRDRYPLTEHDREVIAAFEAQATRKALADREAGLASLAAHKARVASDKASALEVRQAATKSHTRHALTRRRKRR